MLIVQQSLLIVLLCGFIGGVKGMDLSANCSFDQGTFCGWKNDMLGDHFEWTLKHGHTPSVGTGPTDDHTGNGSYIYIETSSPRRYGEWARLTSPPLQGPQQMRFFFHMHGFNVETLTVYVKKNDTETKRWGRMGDHGDRWMEGCVQIIKNGSYQVVIEGATGSSWKSDIAIDDISFSDNFGSCNESVIPTDMLSANCTFDKHLCGWRNTYEDDMNWRRIANNTPSHNTGPSSDHTGNGYYIYIEASRPALYGYTAILLSPRMSGFRCMTFYYHMYGLHMGRIDVMVLTSPVTRYSIWMMEESQVNKWEKAAVTIQQNGEFQIMLIGTTGLSYLSDAAIDDVSFTKEPCGLSKDESPGDCDFDQGFCLWTNDNTGKNKFDWSLRRGPTPSVQTGPTADHTSGRGRYIYLEASSPRRFGDQARLLSPLMAGPQCMTVYYHMYGSTMSCIAVYVKNISSAAERVLWLKSGDRGNLWIEGHVNIQEQGKYQIIIEGTRGASFYGDAAIDDLTFHRGSCGVGDKSTFYVSSVLGRTFQITFHPVDHSGYSRYFKFDVEHPLGDPGEQGYFIYPRLTRLGETFVARKFVIQDYGILPVDYIIAGAQKHNASASVFFIDRGQYLTQMVSLDNYTQVECCDKNAVSQFRVYNVSTPGLNQSSNCFPGWYQIGQNCHLLYLSAVTTWTSARVYCHQQGGSLAILPHKNELKELSRIATSLGYPKTTLYLGLSGKKHWIWQDTGQPARAKLWGPNEPSGDGRCGSFLNAIKWDSQWSGMGWRWNDIGCDIPQQGYICEDHRVSLDPVAFYPLDGYHASADIGPQRLSRGRAVGVQLAPGPFGNLNGSFYFNGSAKSYVEFQKSAGLDTRYSISILAWIYPEKDGPIFNYRRSNFGVHLWVNSPMVLFARFVFRDNRWPVPLISSDIRKDAWNFVGCTYNGDTGEATLWVGNRTVLRQDIGKLELATDWNVRMGSRIGDKRYFRGRVACLQVYPEALSSEQIMIAKRRCKKINESIQCRTGFQSIHGGCFLFNTTATSSWHQAFTACMNMGARLAIIDRQGLRSAMTDVLYNMRPTPDSLLINLVVHEQWNWVDGSPVNSSVWKSNFPKGSSAEKSCATLPAAASKLANVNCDLTYNFVCQSNEINVAHSRSVACSSQLPSYGPARAVDGSYSSCFRSKKEANPWLVVQLDEPMYVYRVTVRYPTDCCTQREGKFVIEVIDEIPNNVYGCKNWTSYGSGLFEDLLCQPPILSQYVRFRISEATTPLVVCHVAVFAFDSSVNAKGVSREAWYHVKYNTKLAPNMKDNPEFRRTRQGHNVIQHFDAPTDVTDLYIQRLAAHIQVDVTGNYTFYVACDDMCELWTFNVFEDGMDYRQNDENAVNPSEPLITLNQYTGHQQWNRYPKRQTSKHVRMSKCRLYKLQAFVSETGGKDNMAVAMRAPNGDFEGPIENRRLYWLLPGKRSLSFVLENDEKWISTSVGSNVQISGHYNFCCHGIYCPDCPLQLYFFLMNERQSINSNVSMNCLNSTFSIRFNADTQPGNYTIKIYHSFVNDLGGKERQREIGNLEVKAIILKECTFVSGLCDWIAYGKNNEQIWKSSDVHGTTLPGSFAYLDGNYRAFLMSQPLPWRQVYRNIGLCLRFSYLIPNTTASHLKVLLSSQSNETLMWHLTGDHGNKWSRGHVSWAARKGTKIIFEGIGVLGNSINVGIDDIVITTEACSLIPYYATPDFRCTAEQFQCDNGECVKKNLLCDGDFACQDKSDEINCECPSNKFSCMSGGCVSATALCNGREDCKDGSDEENCRVKCEGNFQCASGTCVPWSRTCGRSLDACTDNTHRPSICELGRCSLDDIGCPAANSSSSNADEAHCRSFRGLCGFENGLCGMKQDRNVTFFWTLGSAATPTDNTGPRYDHTTFTREGTYIFIEASQRRHGDRAQLLSGNMDPNETVCLQFWYHMFGKDIGNLSVYIRTNQSETLVWRQFGEHGNRWRFAQTALQHEQRYKFVLEGVTLHGNEGDIAVDDLAVMDGSCNQVTDQESPDCYFEEDLCGWEAHKDWILTFYMSDLETSGGFLRLKEDYKGRLRYRNISTPLINTDSYKWKCIRFWYYIGRNHVGQRQSLRVVSYNNSHQVTIFYAYKTTVTWTYVQRPIFSWQTNSKIAFIGYNIHSHDTILAIDDISFSTEPCNYIPPRSLLPEESCGNFDFEKGTLDGWTAVGTAFSSQPTYGDNVKARTRGRDSSNHHGRWWIGSYERRRFPWSKLGDFQGDGPVGHLMSPYIRIIGPSLSFLIGGGCDSTKVGVDFVIDNTIKSYTGNCSEEMRRVVIDVRQSSGRIARLYVNDYSGNVWGHINFDDLRGEYECLESQACDISQKSLCGWHNQNNISEWQQADYEDVEKTKVAIQQHLEQVNDHTISSGAQRLLDDFELHLVNISTGHVILQDVSPFKYGFTICFWLRTRTEGFFIEYNIAAEEEDKLAFSLHHSKFLVVQIIQNIKATSVSLLDGLWHHACETWDSHAGLVEIYKDGQRVEQFIDFRKFLGIVGGGMISIGYRVATGNASTVHGVLAGFNLWDHALSKEEILRMSYGCGGESGNVKSWAAAAKGISGKIEEKPASCKDRKATRLLVKSNSTATNVTTVLVSPRYARSTKWYTQCLKFRYTMFGPGARTLRIYQKVGTFTERPVWEESVNTHSTWRYGQVPLVAVSKYQVSIKGELSSEPGYIAIAGVYIAEFGNCEHAPPRAINACSERLINTSGFIFSPNYPAYYPDDTTCNWKISVPQGYVIRLEFMEFVLEDHPTCDYDFVKVVDGISGSARMLGKFCGFTYPPVVQSSSNHLTVIFGSKNKHYRTGFKAYYHPIKDYKEDSLSCSRHQGCPTNCKCTVIEQSSTQHDSALLVEGQELLMVPSNFPSDTAALMFQRNRISQLREGSFSDLLKLQYVDLSNNIVLHVDAGAFQNLSSLRTMRLNSNFIRILPAGVFRLIANLRVLDLSRNLLGRAAEGIFDGLSRLYVLGLQSNRISKLENGVFNSTGNLTFLYLQDNEIDNLPDGIFSFLSKLEILDLSSNKLSKLTKDSFHGLHSLKRLYLHNNRLTHVSPDAFSELSNLEYLKLDRFILCCYAQKSIPGLDCDSPVDEFSSCDDLMKNKALQICIWILGICAFVGNLFVIAWRLIDQEERRVQSFLLTNLALADLLMGVYLLLIAIMDARWQGNYFKHDIAWRSGVGCKIAGILSMLSSEVSVMILTIITVDRFICIVFPFKFNRLRYKKAFLVCSFSWLFGLLISVLPVAEISYFYDKEKDFGFYSRSAVCLPLQLSADRPVGWEYAIAFFIGLNMVSFVFILFAYVAMFCTVKSASRAVRSTANMSKESSMAKRLLFIVTTDFFCWMPIIIISILSLLGKFHDPKKQAYVWIAVFVLPLNSSINPILYTFSTTRVKNQLARKKKGVGSFVMRNLRRMTSTNECQTTDNWRARPKSDATMLSSVFASPQLLTREGDHKMQKYTPGRVKIRLIEIPAIFQDEASGSVGYVLTWLETPQGLSMKLLKFFGKDEKEAWNRETDLMLELHSRGKQPRLMNYCWHSKACNHDIDSGKIKPSDLKDTSFLICFEFVSSTTLEDFLSESTTTMNSDTVCAVAIDVISAIEHLHAHGICHNNISTRSVLIGYCARVPPVKAVLGGFTRARRVADSEGTFSNWACAEQSPYGSDLEQFGQLLATLLGHCHGSSEYTELHEIMNLCFEDAQGDRASPNHIRILLEELSNSEGVWDSYL